MATTPPSSKETGTPYPTWEHAKWRGRAKGVIYGEDTGDMSPPQTFPEGSIGTPPPHTHTHTHTHTLFTI